MEGLPKSKLMRFIKLCPANRGSQADVDKITELLTFYKQQKPELVYLIGELSKLLQKAINVLEFISRN